MQFASAGAVRKTIIIVAAALALCFGALNAAAAATQSPYTALIAAINAEDFATARAIARDTSKTDAARTANLAFVEALILKRQGRYEEAAAALRAILAQNPRFDRVRGELAHTLFLMGDDVAADHQFSVLAAAAPTTGQRDFYNRFLSAIDSRRPFSWDAFVSLAPNSNLTGGTDDGTVLVGGVPFVGEKRKSGVGVNYGASGAYRFDLGDTRALLFGASIAGKTYTDHTFDSTTLQGFTEVSRDVGGWRLGVGLGAEWRLSGWESARWGVGPQVSARHSFGRAGTLLATASWRAYQYQTDTVFDGSELTLALRHEYAINSATTVAIGGAFIRRNTTMAQHDYTAIRPSIELYREFSNGLIGDLSLSYEVRRHDGDYFLLPEPRHDEILTAGAGVTFRQVSWHGFAPRLEYTFEMYNSNSEHGDTFTHGLGLTLTKRY